MKHTKFSLRQLIYPQKFLWILAWIFGLITVISSLGLVMVSGWFVSMAAACGVLGVVLLYALPSLLIRVFALCRTLARYGDLMISHHAVFALLRDLRVRFFRQWVNLPIISRALDTNTSSQKMNRLVKNIDTLNEFTLRLISPSIIAVASVFIMVILILFLLPKAIISVLCLLLALFFAFSALKMGVKLAVDEDDLTQNRKSLLLDTLPALTSLLIFGRWQDTVSKIDALDNQHQQLTQKAYQLRRNAGFMVQVCIMFAILSLLMTVQGLFSENMPMMNQLLREGAGLLFNGKSISGTQMTTVTPALVLALVFGIFGLIEVVLFLLAEPLALGRSLVAKKQLNQLITTSDWGKTTNHSKNQTDNTLQSKSLELTLNSVCVKQSKAMFGIHDMNVVFGSSMPNLVMGASGIGKSTLLMLLAGELRPESGDITLNGTNYLTIELGQSLGFLGQAVDIFDQTLADNLRLGKPSATDDELLLALQQVDLLDWAKNQPKGLDTPLGEYGMAVSGGQARRIALARLLLNPKKILLLDEPFAGLDYKTCQKVWQSLNVKQQNGDIGILIIATHQQYDFMEKITIIDMTPQKP